MTVMRCLVTASLLAATGCLQYAKGPLPGEPANAAFVQIEGERIRYLDTQASNDPEKPVLVLIHGFGSTLEEFGLILPILINAGYRVVALDLRGHGWSDRPEDGDYSVPAQAKLVQSLLDRLKIEKYVPIGHSWGSSIALELALDHPDRVPKLIMFNGFFFTAQEPLLFSWSRVPGLGEAIFTLFYNERLDEKLAFSMFNPEPFMTEKAVEDALALQERPGTLAASLATIRAMDYTAQEPRHFAVQQPTLLLWGREDQVTPLKYGERMALRIPHARLVVVPRCGHLPMLEGHQLTSDAILRFLNGGEP